MKRGKKSDKRKENDGNMGYKKKKERIKERRRERKKGRKEK